jgi:hypothetical protein
MDNTFQSDLIIILGVIEPTRVRFLKGLLVRAISRRWPSLKKIKRKEEIKWKERPRCRKEIEKILLEKKDVSLVDIASGRPRFKKSPRIFFSDGLRIQACKMLAEEGINWREALKEKYSK